MTTKDLFWRILNNEEIGNFKDYFVQDNLNHVFGKQKKSVLHLAVESSNKELVEFLIQNGADVNIKDKYNNTSLHWLTRLSHYEPYFEDTLKIAVILLKNGAKPNEKDNVGNTPLSYAIHYSEKISTDLIKLLLDYGADPSIKNEYGFSCYDRTNNPEVRKLFEKFER